MAEGNEIWLAYRYADYHEKAPPDAPRLREWNGSLDQEHLEHVTEVNDDWIDLFDEWARKHKGLLRRAFDAACAEMGWKIVSVTKSGDIELEIAPGKQWEFAPFDFDREWDTEAGFELPDLTIGVALSSRYFPRFLDYDDPHGALPNPLNLDDKELGRMVGIAKKHIIAEEPWLADASIMVLMIHY